jgi:hypothetical protein
MLRIVVAGLIVPMVASPGCHRANSTPVPLTSYKVQP